MGRHYGIHVVVNIQKYRLASTVMNPGHTFCVFKAGPMVDIKSFLEDNSALVPGCQKQLNEIYKVATAKNYGFRTINTGSLESLHAEPRGLPSRHLNPHSFSALEVEN